MDTENKSFIRSFEKKPSGMKKSISLIECLKKFNDTNLDDSQNTDIIQTNLERMIDILNRIKKRLILIQEVQQAAEIDWMVDTLLKNRLNDVVVKLEKESDGSNDIEKMLELLEEFSSEFNFKRNIEKMQNVLLSKKAASKKNLFHINEQNFYKIYDIIFNVDFNIFDFCNDVNRENLLPTIAGNVLHYFNVDSNLDTEKLKNFLIEIRNGYKKANYYHNVSLINIGHSCCRCYTDNLPYNERIHNECTNRIRQEGYSQFYYLSCYT
jgi:hypothetical protein